MSGSCETYSQLLVVLSIRYHKARRLLNVKCAKCYKDIDSGDEYRKYVAVIGDMFYWECRHDACTKENR